MKIDKYLGNPVFLTGILTLIVLVVSSQSYFFEPKTFEPGGLEYTRFNNYVIFKQSFVHLIEQQDIYQLFPSDHWDLYKYSPAFALLMFPFAQLPDAAGLFCWNLLNVLLLFFALWRLPGFTEKKRLWIAGFVLIELITSIQNAQSNGLVAGLLLYGFVLFEHKKPAQASLLIVLTIFIKLFGLVALLLALFYPQRLKTLLYVAGWTVLLIFLPLLVVSFAQLECLYRSWFSLLQNDHSVSIGLSVAGWLYSWFGLENNNLVVLAGALFLLLPLYRYKLFQEYTFRLLYLASILIWVVIFNHKAESPTYIIAVSGVAIWFFSQRKDPVNIALVVLAFIFTILSPTDLFPKSIQHDLVEPFVLKAVPCILIWVKITLDLLFYKPNIDTSKPRALPQPGV